MKYKIFESNDFDENFRKIIPKNFQKIYKNILKNKY